MINTTINSVATFAFGVYHYMQPLLISDAIDRFLQTASSCLRARSTASQTTHLPADGAPGSRKSSSPHWKTAVLRRGTNRRFLFSPLITSLKAGSSETRLPSTSLSALTDR